MELLHFWHPWVGSTFQHPPNSEEDPGSGLAVGVAVQSHYHPFICQAWWFLEVSDYLSPRLEASPHLRGSPVGGIQMESQTNMTRMQLHEIKWFAFHFLPGPLCPQ